ncbi:hypothetical protein K2X40_00235 [Candidatus Babeliales bacterium]|nr:hypothetical protein [Candidatus Babeliales bacterium]
MKIKKIFFGSFIISCLFVTVAKPYNPAATAELKKICEKIHEFNFGKAVQILVGLKNKSFSKTSAENLTISYTMKYSIDWKAMETQLKNGADPNVRIESGDKTVVLTLFELAEIYRIKEQETVDSIPFRINPDPEDIKKWKDELDWANAFVQLIKDKIAESKKSLKQLKKSLNALKAKLATLAGALQALVP